MKYTSVEVQVCVRKLDSEGREHIEVVADEEAAEQMQAYANVTGWFYGVYLRTEDGTAEAVGDFSDVKTARRVAKLMDIGIKAERALRIAEPLLRSNRYLAEADICLDSIRSLFD